MKVLDIIKKILKILYYILIVFCVLLIMIIVMQKITESNKSVFGYRLFVVISGSMVPKYNMGEVVVCKETPVNEIKLGDSIVYKGKEGEIAGKTVMHEVVDIQKDENNNYLFYAKGLTNEEEDPTIVREQIYGVVKWKSKILTEAYKWATNARLSFLILFILVVNVFLSFKSGRKEKKQIKPLEGNTAINSQILNDNDEQESDIENEKKIDKETEEHSEADDEDEEYEEEENDDEEFKDDYDEDDE